MAHIYKKIAKSKNITYYLMQNTARSVHMCVLADLHRIHGYEHLHEEVACWFSGKSKSIEWNDDIRHLIDENLIRIFIFNL